MKVKSLALAVAGLAVVTAAVWFLKRDNNSGPAADARIGQTLLDSATVAKIGGLHLRSDGNEVTLTGIDPAGMSAGVVKEYHDLPADYTKFVRLIDDLTKDEAKITRMVASSPERLEKLGFDGDHIELRDKDGKAIWTLHLGNSPTSGGKFVKFGDESKAYLSGFSAWLDTSAKGWADAALIPGTKADDVVGIQARFPDGGTLTATRVDGKGVWKSQDLADGETLKDSELGSLASKLTGLRFTDTREPESLETIAGRPTARTYTITLADGRTYTITASQRQDPAPAPAEPPAEGATPPAPPPQPADVYVQSSRAEDRVNALMKQRSFQVADWTFTGLPASRDALVNVVPAATAAPATSESSTPPTDAPASNAPATDAAAPATPEPAVGTP